MNMALFKPCPNAAGSINAFRLPRIFISLKNKYLGINVTCGGMINVASIRTNRIFFPRNSNRPNPYPISAATAVCANAGRTVT